MPDQPLDPQLFDLYDQYAHNRLDRRQFIDRLKVFAVGGLTVPAILERMLPDYDKLQVSAHDPRLHSDYIEYDSPEGGGTIKGLLSRSKDGAAKLPGVLVIHENRGLNPYIEDVSRRAALAGFIALAPDALTPLGGYPGNDDEGRTLQRKRDREEMTQDFIAGLHHLRKHPNCTGKVGVVGFCFGGAMSNALAVRVPELAAAVPFYGGQPEAADVPQIQAPLMLQFAGLDERVNAGWPAYEAALMEHQKEYTAHFYPEVKHGFHNDTTPRYDEATAKLAWDRTVAFFRAKLG